MKKKILIGVAIFLVAVIAFLTWFRSHTKSFSPAATASYNQNGLIMQVNYCQPYKKGRIIFGDETSGAIQPYGKYWRLGANEATTFETNKDILFGDKELKAGKYQVYAVPGKDTWQVCINSDWNRWGYNEAEHNKDLVNTTVPANNSAPQQEQLVLGFDPTDETGKTHFTIHWDQTMIKVPVSAH